MCGAPENKYVAESYVRDAIRRTLIARVIIGR
jgi:hypothetical protein